MFRKEVSDHRFVTLGIVSVVALIGIVVILILVGPSYASEPDDTEPEDAFSVAMNPERDYLVLVNEDHEYVFGGEYDQALQPDIIYASDCDVIPTPVEKGAYLAFDMLRTDLFRKGFKIELYSAYRTKEDQEWVMEHFGNLEDWTEHNTVLPAGFSEHHTGLMISFVVWWPDETNDGELAWCEETAERQAMYPELNIIRDTLADYGFIERYPAGKEDVTGVAFEPYELRFVGSSKVAHEIMDNDLCLEEYLALE